MSHLQSAMGAQRFGEFEVMFYSRCLQGHSGGTTHLAVGLADDLNGNIGIGICPGCSENHEFEESHGETHENEEGTLGNMDT